MTYFLQQQYTKLLIASLLVGAHTCHGSTLPPPRKLSRKLSQQFSLKWLRAQPDSIIKTHNPDISTIIGLKPEVSCQAKPTKIGMSTEEVLAKKNPPPKKLAPPNATLIFLTCCFALAILVNFFTPSPKAKDTIDNEEEEEAIPSSSPESTDPSPEDLDGAPPATH